MIDAVSPDGRFWSAPGLDDLCIEAGWGDDDRARTIGPRVLTLPLPLNPPAPELVEQWQVAQRDWSGPAGPGRIEAMSVQYRLITDDLSSAVHAWLNHLDVDPGKEQLSALACQGASFHHDAAYFVGSAFLVVWLSEDAGWDLVLPQVDVRIPLVRDLAVIFDPSLVHGVVRRGRAEFMAGDFVGPAGTPPTLGAYVCMDLPMSSPSLRRHLGVQLLSPEEAALRHPLASTAAGSIEDRVDDRTGVLQVASPGPATPSLRRFVI